MGVKVSVNAYVYGAGAIRWRGENCVLRLVSRRTLQNIFQGWNLVGPAPQSRLLVPLLLCDTGPVEVRA